MRSGAAMPAARRSRSVTWLAYSTVSSCRQESTPELMNSSVKLSSYFGSGGSTADSEAVSTTGSG